MKKGEVTIYLFWFLAAVMVLVVAALVAPMGVLFTTELMVAGEDVLLMANESIQDIENTTIRNSVTSVIGEALEAGEDNITILSDIFQYAWVIVLVLSGIVAFLFTRQLVEFQGGGFV